MKKLFLIVPFLFLLLSADSVYVEQDFKDGLISKDIDITGDAADGDGYIQFQTQSGDAPTPGSGTSHVNIFAKDKKLYTAVDDGAGTPVIAEVGSGAGSGAVNYIDNYDFESQNITGWEKYDDGAVDAPVDATGGTTSFTGMILETSSPRIGAASIKISHGGGGDMQGEGVSYGFSVDEQFKDHPQMFKIAFYYKITSGTFDYGTWGDASDPSALTVYIVGDPDNSEGSRETIQPSTYTFSGAGYFEAVFQTSASYLDYKLAFHSVSYSTSYSMVIDNISVGPQRKVIGPVITDWKELSGVTISNIATYTGTFYYARTGNLISVKGSVVASANATSTVTLNLPFLIDFDRMPAGITGVTTAYQNIGRVWLKDSSGTLHYQGGIIRNNTSATAFWFLTEGDGLNETWGPSVPGSDGIDDTDILIFEINNVPVTGWGGTTLLSSEGESRVVAARLGLSANQTINVGTETIIFDQAKTDEHSLCNLSTGVCTIKTAGKYKISYSISAVMGATAATSATAYIRIDSAGAFAPTKITNMANNGTYPLQNTTTQSLNAGQTIDVQAAAVGQAWDADGHATEEWTTLNIERIADPSAIAATEVVAAKYWASTSSTSESGGANELATGATAVIDFDTKIYDTHNAVTTGASWAFKAPYPGYYEVKVVLSSTGTLAWTQGESFELTITGGTRLDSWVSNATYSSNSTAVGSTVVKLNTGETLSTSLFQNSGGSWNISNSANNSWISIHRIGGVL